MSYYYFISSLPTLTFGEKPPMSTSDFIENSKQWLPKNDWQDLNTIAKNSNELKKNIALKWKNFNENLIYLLAAERATRLGKDQSPYLEKAGLVEPAVRSAVQDALKASDPSEAERILDKIKWNFLDDISIMHHFDFNIALSYLLKLKILERRATLDKKTGKDILNKSIQTKE